MKTQERVDQMKTVYVKGYYHVLIPRYRNNPLFADPNYRDMNKALCGILKHGQSLESFKEEYIKRNTPSTSKHQEFIDKMRN